MHLELGKLYALYVHIMPTPEVKAGPVFKNINLKGLYSIASQEIVNLKTLIFNLQIFCGILLH